MLFGDIELSSQRLRACPCRGAEGPGTVSPLGDLIPEKVSPERLYLEARWASLVPYAAAAELMSEVLPIIAGANAMTSVSTCWAWLNAPKQNSARSSTVSSMAALHNGRSCRSRKAALSSASMAAMC